MLFLCHNVLLSQSHNGMQMFTVLQVIQMMSWTAALCWRSVVMNGFFAGALSAAKLLFSSLCLIEPQTTFTSLPTSESAAPLVPLSCVFFSSASGDCAVLQLQRGRVCCCSASPKRTQWVCRWAFPRSCVHPSRYFQQSYAAVSLLPPIIKCVEENLQSGSSLSV